MVGIKLLSGKALPNVAVKQKSFTPQYKSSKAVLVSKVENVASTRFVYTRLGLSKEEARVLLRENKIGLTEAQTKTALACLKDGRADKVNMKLNNAKTLKLTMERPGRDSGFQRMSYDIDISGEKRFVVQTAFDDQLKLVRQKGGVLFDVKKPRGKK